MTTSLNLPSPENLGHGVRRYWLSSQIVVVATQGDMSPAAVDEWARCTKEAVLSYPIEHQAVYMLQDLSHPKQRLTPYARQKTEDLYKSVTLSRPVYIAVVLQNTLVNQLVSIFVRFLNRSQPLLKERIFTSSDVAIHWLEETINAQR